MVRRVLGVSVAAGAMLDVLQQSSVVVSGASVTLAPALPWQEIRICSKAGSMYVLG